jgi:hypothetical protein
VEEESLDFSQINHAMAKLEEQEATTEEEEEQMVGQVNKVWACLQAEEQAILSQMSDICGWLCWLCKQKRMLKEREQKMFSKGLVKVEELERLEAFSAESSAHATSVNLSTDLAAMSPETFKHFLEMLPVTPGASGIAVAGSLWGLSLVPRCFLYLDILSIWWDIADPAGPEFSLLWIHFLPEFWNEMFPV